MDDSPEPDSFEKRIRFGCGFVIGALIAFFFALSEFAAFTSTFWAVVVGVAIVFGFLAMRYGNGFWRVVSEWVGRANPEAGLCRNLPPLRSSCGAYSTVDADGLH